MCEHLDAHLERPLRDVVWGSDADLLNHTGYAQTGLFAVEVALFRLLASCGVRPSHVAGHSVGELVAAHVSGVLSLPDACRLVAVRGRLMQALPEGGAMVAVAATVADVTAVVAGLGDRVGVAAVNGPGSVVVSGEREVLAGLFATWESEGRRVRWLPVSHGFHSALMRPVLAELASLAESLVFGELSIPGVSTVTGAPVTDEWSDPAYWAQQVVQPVLFGDAVTSLLDAGVSYLVEVGPGQALTTAIAAGVATDTQMQTIALLPGAAGEVEALLSALAAGFSAGIDVDWTKIVPERRHLALPTYPFQHRRYWATPAHGTSSGRHPLLDSATELPDDRWVLTGRLSLNAHSWLADHTIDDTTILPGTAFVELAVHAADTVGCSAVDELTIENPMVLTSADVTVQVTVGPTENDGRSIEMHSRRDGAGLPWQRHATGRLALRAAATPVDDGPCGRRPGRRHFRSTGSTTSWSTPDTATGPRSTGSERPGVGATSCSSRLPCPRRTAGSDSTRHCWTRYCTAWRSPAARSRRKPKPSCRSRGRAYGCTRRVPAFCALGSRRSLRPRSGWSHTTRTASW
ncbi:hypothetical protein GCM10029964_055800 [Kibdelosporangium lantanae]